MRSRIFKLILYVLLLVIVIAFNITCKKEAKEQAQNHNCPQGQHWDESKQKCVSDSILVADTTDNLLSDKSILIDSVNVLEVKDNSVTINVSSLIKKPIAGSIILGAPSSVAEYGFIRKVTSVTGNDSKLVCTTELAGLNEAFRQLHLDYNYVDTFSSNYSAKEGASLSANFTNKVLGDGLTFNGVVKINIPSVKLKYDLKKGSLKPELVLIQADLNTEGSEFNITYKKDIKIEIIAKELTEFKLPTIHIPIPILTPVGIIAIPYPFTEKLVLNILPASISGSVKWNVTPTMYATLGCKYENGAWQNISSFSTKAKDFSDFCKKDFFISANAKYEVTIFSPRYEIAPLGIEALKGFFEVPNKVSFDVKVTSPNYSFKYLLGIKGGIETKFWLSDKQTFDVSKDFLEETIAEGNWSLCGDVDSLFILSGDNQTGDVSKPLEKPLIVKLIDSFSNPVEGIDIKWTTTDGTITPSDNKTDVLGQAKATWTLGSKAGSQTAFANANATDIEFSKSSVSFKATAKAVVIALTTNAATSITQTSAVSGGNITDDGGASITARGVCWSTSHNPTTTNDKTNDGTGNGSFVSNIIGLTTNTTYYVRAYATNSAGTAYGNEVSFTTASSSIQGINYSLISYERHYHDSNGNTYDVSDSGGEGALTLYPNTDSCTLSFKAYAEAAGQLLSGKYLGTNITLYNAAYVDGLFHPLTSPITFSTLDQEVTFTMRIAYYYPLNDVTYYDDDPVVLKKQ